APILEGHRDLARGGSSPANENYSVTKPRVTHPVGRDLGDLGWQDITRKLQGDEGQCWTIALHGLGQGRRVADSCIWLRREALHCLRPCPRIAGHNRSNQGHQKAEKMS